MSSGITEAVAAGGDDGADSGSDSRALAAALPVAPVSRAAYAEASATAPADTLFGQQWYLFSTAGGINVLPVWADYTGKGVKVAVFDQGIDYTHADLDGNYIAAGSINTLTGGTGGYPLDAEDEHGTAVAGVIAAERNGSGIVGVAYNADLLSYYNPLNASASEFAAQAVRAFTAALQADVINNSWSFGNQFFSTPNAAFVDDFAASPFQAAGQALARLAAEGRHGLGTLVVQAAGNSDQYGDDTNLHSFQNSRFSVVVAGTDAGGWVTSYSVSGASLLVAAPGGGGSSSSTAVLTTDRVGSEGYAGGDFAALAGTSFATPIVSGVIALMLEANPTLGWRDVQEILSLSARQTGAAGGWQFNGATDWNGGGRHYSEEYGYGLIDATAAVRLAETWTRTNTSADEMSIAATVSTLAAIPDSNTFGISQTALLGGGFEVEWITIALDLTHSWIGDLRISLTSPGGTVATLLDSPGAGLLTRWGSSQQDIRFTFSAAGFRGEDAGGAWRLSVVDDVASDTGTLNSWTITAYGEWDNINADYNDTYYYTNEFGTLTDDLSTRQHLADRDGGSHDAVNAAAVTSGSRIDISGRTDSQIAGRTLRIVSETIEDAYGGDGNDTLIADAGDNYLYGGRGDDLLQGGSDNDTLAGGPGNDTLDGGDGFDVVSFAGSLDGVSLDAGDVLISIEAVWGSNAADSLTGWATDDQLSGGAGNDTVDGGDGNDYVAGESGDDSLSGGAGQDWLWGGSGNDTLDGGAEKDNLNGEAGDDLIRGGDGNDRITGQAGNDTIHAGEGNDWVGVWNDWGEQPELNYFPEWGDDLIWGEGGDDVLSAGFGNDTVHGGIGNDYVAGEQGDDLLFGNEGVDWLWGGSGNDTMEGGEGDDVLIGEEGFDLLTGGAGADVFAFLSLGHAGDRILDFDGLEGDRIDVSGLLSEQNYAGPDPFGEGRLLWEESGAHVLFRFDTTLIATIENTSLAQLNDGFFIV